MEQKLVRVPFDLELAKRITNKEIEGRIVTRDGRSARIICWDKIDNKNYHIVALVKDNKDDLEYSCFYTDNGKYTTITDISNSDLMLEIPEYLTFKDGDIYKTGIGSIAIYNANYNAACNNTPFYVGFRFKDNSLSFHKEGSDCGFGSLEECSLNVTESDKQKFIDALKAGKEPKAKEYLKRFFGIEEKPECKFKPFDKVLVKDNEDEEWHISFFAREIVDGSDGLPYKYECSIGALWNYCIPFEGNEHLLADKIVTD